MSKILLRFEDGSSMWYCISEESVNAIGSNFEVYPPGHNLNKNTLYEKFKNKKNKNTEKIKKEIKNKKTNRMDRRVT